MVLGKFVLRWYLFLVQSHVDFSTTNWQTAYRGSLDFWPSLYIHCCRISWDLVIYITVIYCESIVFFKFPSAAMNYVRVPVNWARRTSFEHDDVIKWKHFPRYWRFVRGIHRSPRLLAIPLLVYYSLWLPWQKASCYFSDHIEPIYAPKEKAVDMISGHMSCRPLLCNKMIVTWCHFSQVRTILWYI